MMNQTYKKNKQSFNKITARCTQILMLMLILFCALLLSGCSHKNEWAKSKGILYYYDENGEIVTDCILEIEGEKYRFDENGVYCTGWYQDGTDWYYFDTAGKMVRNQDYVIDDACYFFTDSGKRFSGWRGNVYYRADGRRGEGPIQTDRGWYFFGENGEPVCDGWIVYQENWYHAGADMQLYTSEEVKIDDSWYYFDESARCYSGWWEDSYYGADGARYGSGSAEIDGNWYLFDIHGKIRRGWYMVNNQMWLYGDDGMRAVDRVSWYDGSLYCLDESGKKVCSQLYSDENGTYYFTEDGTALLHGVATIEGAPRCFDREGRMVTGRTYEIDGGTYYFDENGSFMTGWQETELGLRYFGEDGRMALKGVLIGEEYYYFREDGSMLTGWRISERGKYYYFEDGTMALNEPADIDGNSYYFGETGAAVAGVCYREDGIYCYDEECIMIKNERVTIDGAEYYLLSDGKAFIGWSTDHKRNIVYYCSDGKKAVSRKVEIEGAGYYFNENGYMVTGWNQEGDDWFYYNEEGQMYTGGWLSQDGKNYYFGGDGRMHRGMLALPEGIFYFNSDGVQQFNQSVDVEGYRYLLTANGSCYTGWRDSGGNRYYYQADGKQCFGNSCVDGKWYFFNGDGSMHTGWLNIGGASFYYGSDGVRYQGERVVHGVTYMFTETGSYVIQNHPGNSSLGQSGSFTEGTGEYVVVLDAGHGGVWTGASYYGMKEKDLSLQVALYCKAELEQYKGVTVYLTRSSDVALSANLKQDLEQRAEYALSVDADLLVSLHFNASVNHTVSGASAYISSKSSVLAKSQKLANSILAQLGGLGLRNMGYLTAVSDEYISADGTAADYYAINRHCANRGFPGIIVEHCFMDNPSDLPYINSSGALQRLGVADAVGIASYLGLQKK